MGLVHWRINIAEKINGNKMAAPGCSRAIVLPFLGARPGDTPSLPPPPRFLPGAPPKLSIPGANFILATPQFIINASAA